MINCNITNLSSVSQFHILANYTHIDDIYTIFSWILLSIGIPANLLSIIVLTSQYVTHVTSTLILLLTISDLINLLLFMISLLNFTFMQTLLTHTIACKFWIMLIRTMMFNSHLLSLLLSIDRLITLKWPYKRSTTKEKIKSGAIVFMVSFLLSTKELYFYGSSKIANSTYSPCEHLFHLDEQNEQVSLIDFILNAIILNLVIIGIPIVVFVLNIHYIIAIRQHGHKLIDLSDIKPRTLLFMSFYFLCTSIPKVFLVLLYPRPKSGVVCLSKNGILEDKAWKNILNWHYYTFISIILFYSYYSFKFFIYLWTSKLFQFALIARFRWYKQSSIKVSKSTTRSIISVFSKTSRGRLSAPNQNWGESQADVAIDNVTLERRPASTGETSSIIEIINLSISVTDSKSSNHSKNEDNNAPPTTTEIVDMSFFSVDTKFTNQAIKDDNNIAPTTTEIIGMSCFSTDTKCSNKTIKEDNESLNPIEMQDLSSNKTIPKVNDQLVDETTI